MPVQWMPIGLSVNEPMRAPQVRVVAAREVLRAMRATMPFQPPASIRPRIGISSAPSQISTNCSTSLKMAESRPPRPT